MKIETRIAQLFSTLLHPLLIPTLGILLLFHLNTFQFFVLTPKGKQIFLLTIFLNTAIAPAISILLLKKLGTISDITLSDRSERRLPLFYTTILFFFTYYFLSKMAWPFLLSFYVIGASVLALLTFSINHWWKISIHMISIGGLSGFIISTAMLYQLNIDWLIIGLFFISGVLGTTRLILNAHNLVQVFAGYLLGVTVMLLLFFFLR